MDTLEVVKGKAFDFGKYLLDHWMTVVILGVSATQTYYLVSTFAPAWALWLPALGVCLMEGGYLYWRWREYEADPLDIDGKQNTNKQESIANVMVYLTLGASVLTMLAGAALEISQSELAYILKTIPDMETYLGLFAVVCIFLLAGGHLYADWQYRRNDPDAVMERNFRESERELERARRKANIEGQKIVMEGRNNELRRLYDANGANMGRSKAAEEFEAIANKPKTNPQSGNGNMRS
jgi:uncharacterized Tic20 family protein